MKRYPACMLATCCIPWNEDYSFAEQIFRRQVRYLLQHATKHLYIFGTAGEGYAVSDDQFAQITEVFCDQMRAGGAEPMVGIISLSLPTIVERIRRAYGMGVRQFQISLPAWGRCTFDEIHHFFADTCGKFEDCNFLNYNNSRTKRLITAGEYAPLAGDFPNLVATKNSTNSVTEVVTLIKNAPQMQHFFTEQGFALTAMLGLEAGFLVSVASINWKTAKLFFQACTERKIEQIANYVIELIDINNTLFTTVGEQGHIDSAYDKMFAKIADEQFDLRLLPPYGYADNETFRQFVRFLKDKYPHWAPEG